MANKEYKRITREEKPLTFGEKLRINVFTPLEYAGINVVGKKRMEYGSPDEEGVLEEDENYFEHKIDCYNHLLDHLEKGETRFAKRYMGSTCGRIQVKEAYKRGAITPEEYKEIKDNYKERKRNK